MVGLEPLFLGALVFYKLEQQLYSSFIGFISDGKLPSA